MKEASAVAHEPSHDPFRLVGTRLDGKYTVEALVAEGGFGVVYRCSHTELQKTVALKVLKIPSHHGQAARGEFFRKFANEARTIARIDHEAIVRVLDFGSTIMPTGDLAPWMALEWLEGQTLERDLDARAETGLASRSPGECLALLRPVIEAVALAHEEGIAHRDIKPGNLMMVTNRRGEVRLKLLDFGVAKVMTDDDRSTTLGQTSTQAHLQMFSLEYAAPEQLSGTRTGPWTDVHALSLVLTEMLTGEPPYEGEDSVEIFSEALDRRRPTPARWGLDVGPWEPVLQRSLALRPADRFPDAGSFLKAMLADVPEQAVWREDLPPALAPVSDRPTAAASGTPVAQSDPPPAAPSPPAVASIEAPPATPAIEASIAASGTVTELLPEPPSRVARDDDQEPVSLPINRLGWVGWVATLVGAVAIGAAVIAVRPREPVRVPPTLPVVAAPALPLAPTAPTAPIVAGPAVVVPVPAAAGVPEAPPPSAVPAVVPTPVVTEPTPRAMPAPTRSPARRARPSDGRIPIE